MLTYRLEPDIPDIRFSVRDRSENDEPRLDRAWASKEAASIGIIGGVDGPSAIFITSPKTDGVHISHSSLHFELVDMVTWRMEFREKLQEDMCVKLIE